MTESDGKTYKTVLELNEGKFEIISSNLLVDERGVRDEFESKFGAKKELTNHRQFFALGNSTISINQIEGVGDFLIIEAENPTSEILYELGISKDAIVTASFDNL